MRKFKAGKMYFVSFGVIQVSRRYNSGDYGDPEMRWYVEGMYLNINSGLMESVNMLASSVGDEVSNKDFIALRKKAIKNKLSVEALRFLGVDDNDMLSI